MNGRKAFTLIEVLVVVAIIALLIGILLPSLSAARRQAKLVSCATRLNQVGKGMISYTSSNRDRMPHISAMPSFGPGPLTVAEPVYFADVLKVHLKGDTKVLQCPNDVPGFTDRIAPNSGKSFYQTERSSYEYRIRLAGLAPAEFGPAVSHFRHHDDGEQHNENIPSNTIWITRDYDNFHATKFIKNPADDTERPKGGFGARRYLYIDGHVTDFELY